MEQALVVGALIAIQIAIGIYLNVRLFKSIDDNEHVATIRIFAPIITGVTLMVGIVLFQIYSLIDGSGNEFGFLELVKVELTLVALTFLYYLKGILGPLVLMVITSWSTYQYAVNGIGDLSTLYDPLFDFLLFWAPEGVKTVFVFASLAWLIINTVSSIIDIDL